MSYRYQIAIIFLLGFFIDCINIFMSAIALPAIAADMKVSRQCRARRCCGGRYAPGFRSSPKSRW